MINAFTADGKEDILVEDIEVSSFYNIRIGRPETIGRAILIKPRLSGVAILVDITVYDPANRRKGFGSQLLSFITNYFPAIITGGIGESTPAGIELCLKNGFRWSHKPNERKCKPFLVSKHPEEKATQ